MGPRTETPPKGWGTRTRPKAAGVSHDRTRAQTSTCTGPGLQNTTKIQRKDPQEREERMKIVAGEGEKGAKFWAVRQGPAEGVRGERPNLGATTKILNTHITTHDTRYTTQHTSQHNTTTTTTTTHTIHLSDSPAFRPKQPQRGLQNTTTIQREDPRE